MSQHCISTFGLRFPVYGQLDYRYLLKQNLKGTLQTFFSLLFVGNCLIFACVSATGLLFSFVNKQRENVVGQTVLAPGPAGLIDCRATSILRAPVRSQDLPVLQR